MKKWDQEIVSPLKHFTFNLITATSDEFEKYSIHKKNFDKRSLNFLIKAQKKLDTYIHDFKKVVNPTVRTAVEEGNVANLQGQYLTDILAEIPTDKSELNELLSIKVLEAFALHNRNLATNWNNSLFSSE